MNKTFSGREKKRFGFWNEKKTNNLNGLSEGRSGLLLFGLRWESWLIVFLCCLGLFIVVDERDVEDLFVFFCKIVFELSPISFVLWINSKK